MNLPRVPNRPISGSKIFLVGENPWIDEVARGFPFAGASGFELDRMLHDGGMLRSECSVGNVIQYKPPTNDISHFIEERKTVALKNGWRYSPLMRAWTAPCVEQHLSLLHRDIQETNPAVIIALGNTPLRALCGVKGITDWRGSILETKDLRRRDGRVFKVVPAYHPAAVLRQWSWRHITVHDLRRAERESHFEEVRQPNYQFHVSPCFGQVMSWTGELLAELAKGPRLLSFDIETKARQITCFGIGKSELEAMCVPLVDLRKPGGNYWSSLEEEVAIVERLVALMSHPNARPAAGQNFNYDNQYLARQWSYVLWNAWDTMIAHHTNFTELPKGLDFLSSMYCKFHRFWKNEGKEWGKGVPEEQLWAYNAKDCVITWEVAQALRALTEQAKQSEQVEFEEQLQRPVLRMMLRGVRVDTVRKARLSAELQEKQKELQSDLDFIIGHPLNPGSPKIRDFFYNDMRQPIVANRKTRRPSTDDESLAQVCKREPFFTPICRLITDLRSLRVFRSTFLEAVLEEGRVRCSYNIAGTVTFRFSSSQDAFGSGMNLQNIPKGDEESGGLFPNIRKMFIPDPGYTIMDWDLDRADLQVVVWESGEEELKAMLHAGIDLHEENARVLGCKRQVAKMFVHGTNYGGSARTMAINCGLTTHESEKMQQRWFARWPGIKQWHRRVEVALHATRTVANAFGFRRYFFDRTEGLLPEALAWVPQSTVAIVINKGLLRLDEELYPTVQPLMQVHDSLVMQVPTARRVELAHEIKRRLEVTIPYDDPLIIPVSGKWSEVSLGDCTAIPA